MNIDRTRNRSGWLRTATFSAAALVVVGAIGALTWPTRSNSVENAGTPPPTAAASTPQPSTSLGAAAVAERAGPLVSPLDLEVRVPLRILAVDPITSSLAMIDLEHGTATRYPPGTHPLSGDPVKGAVITAGGETLIWTGQEAWRFLESLDRADGVLRPADVADVPGIAPSLAVAPNPGSTEVWLVQQGHGCCGSTNRQTMAELVDLATGEQVLRAELDPNSSPAVATTDGLLFNTFAMVETTDGLAIEPGSPLVRQLSPTGAVSTVGTGTAIAATSSILVRMVCDATEADCDLLLSDSQGGNTVTVDRPTPGGWYPIGGPAIPTESPPLPTISPDGYRLLIATDLGGADEGSRNLALWVLDMADGTTHGVANLEVPMPVATWSRDGRWIVVIDERDLLLIDADDPATTLSIPGAIPDDHYPLAAG